MMTHVTDEDPRICPSCAHGFDLPLILPCSHTLCGRCLTGGAGPGRRGGGASSHPVVLCPNCRHGVELPCFDWSSALTCLPFDPTVTFDPAERGKREDRRWETDGSVDLSEEEMESSVSGLLFSLDSSCSDSSLHLSSSALTVAVTGHVSSSRDGGPLPQVSGSVSVSRGQYYWEVDVCNSAIYRIGVISSCDGRGWWLERRGSAFRTVFDGQRELLPSVPPQLKTVGVFLNVGGASITFHNTVTQEFLAAIPAHFSAPLRPAFQLGQGRLKLRPGLPPPNHVFLSHSSAYRGPGGAGGGRWRRDVAFGSVRAVIQKFEEISAAISDSDSGLVSSISSLPETQNGTERLRSKT
ncbi:cardiomyopathy-associated protein 5-like [Puntigrus tetrazona]|uniref:cardiomyopathy-associated protein 5-like n=1 Tax=Puntigrus tetrazona TaxID=1606681 RepID=UPI001C89A4D5|nr:cardiomyopathy-associated protein 5-like [Puntigrus tetrazona]